ncbi:nucleotide exchange factor GrpE [Bifidobacterium sp. W8101]|uniref:nucleotide exchange factor GrpE n=1 Tax=Bifidobacterium TaxID=1678 RepID=UPI0018DB07C0|nr:MULTISPECIES: nucleotide exchange factor GrpE [Bifidobacterium]MBI0126089.1 nucleotide exchange factor GrpE [Bifidobacterium choladohabitans]MBI0127658.1 nucleotide exchange factor GrpE [Bifidobacterium sp. W8103]MBI0138246.1 nucleotide exchange factor GrpE [Bifidobacterium sp. W8105]MBI0148784.1 nucleotide exchange factor GrpE [Bifidobacterium sp. W8107]
MSAFDKDDAGPLKGDPAAAGEPDGNEAKASDAASTPEQEAARGHHADKSAADEGQAAGQTSSDSSPKDGSPADTQADDKTDADSAKEDGADKGSDGLTPLGQAKKEAADYLEALQRERAEFVNFRNRAKKEQDIFRQHGIVDVLTALLPALDDIDRIKEHGQMDDSFQAVAKKIDKTFEKFGVEKFGEKGEDFDPTKHEAILHKPDPDAKKETVDTVVEAGYRIGDRVIRAARVVVTSPGQ